MVLAQGYEIQSDGTLVLPEGVKPKREVPSNLIPYCPHCVKPMTMNLRADATFVEDDSDSRNDVFHSIDKFLCRRRRLVGIPQPVGKCAFRFQRDSHQVGVDILVNRLCDQNVGIYLAEREGVDVIPSEIDELDRRIFLMDVVPKRIELFGNTLNRHYKILTIQILQ